MSYGLVYTSRAEKDIRKLGEAVKKRIGKALLQYKETPLKYAERLTHAKFGTYRFRIGDYRVIFRLLKGDATLF